MVHGMKHHTEVICRYLTTDYYIMATIIYWNSLWSGKQRGKKVNRDSKRRNASGNDTLSESEN